MHGLLDVQEITVDGQTVFSAGPRVEPVSYSDVIGFYPFDSSTYGGSNTDDVTATFNPTNSGDSTAHDLTKLSNPSHVSSGGVTDINAGANSGAFDFDGSDDGLQFTGLKSVVADDVSFVAWVNANSTSGDPRIHNFGFTTLTVGINNGQFRVRTFDGSSNLTDFGSPNTNEWYCVALTSETAGGTTETFVQSENASSPTTRSLSHGNLRGSGDNYNLGNRDNGDRGFDGVIDNLLIYDKIITSSEFSSIYVNTQP